MLNFDIAIVVTSSKVPKRHFAVSTTATKNAEIRAISSPSCADRCGLCMYIWGHSAVDEYLKCPYRQLGRPWPGPQVPARRAIVRHSTGNRSSSKHFFQYKNTIFI